MRMSQLQRGGSHFKSNGISYERFAALQCLVGEGPFRDMAEPMEFHRLTVELKGFEEWLWQVHSLFAHAPMPSDAATPITMSIALSVSLSPNRRNSPFDSPSATGPF